MPEQTPARIEDAPAVGDALPVAPPVVHRLLVDKKMAPARERAAAARCGTEKVAPPLVHRPPVVGEMGGATERAAAARLAAQKVAAALMDCGVVDGHVLLIAKRLAAARLGTDPVATPLVHGLPVPLQAGLDCELLVAGEVAAGPDALALADRRHRLEGRRVSETRGAAGRRNDGGASAWERQGVSVMVGLGAWAVAGL